MFLLCHWKVHQPDSAWGANQSWNGYQKELQTRHNVDLYIYIGVYIYKDRHDSNVKDLPFMQYFYGYRSSSSRIVQFFQKCQWLLPQTPLANASTNVSTPEMETYAVIRLFGSLSYRKFCKRQNSSSPKLFDQWSVFGFHLPNKILLSNTSIHLLTKSGSLTLFRSNEYLMATSLQWASRLINHAFGKTRHNMMPLPKKFCWFLKGI